MELVRAREIISMLANGIDPCTGEIFPEDSPYQQPEVIRALFTVEKYLNTVNKVKRDKPLPTNAGLPWDEKQEQQLLTLYHSGLAVKQIAFDLGRTVGAVNARLEKLGILTGESIGIERQQ